MASSKIDEALSGQRRVYLRPVEYGDLDFTLRNRQHPEIRAATLGRVFPVTPENELRWYQGLGVGEYPGRVVFVACNRNDVRVGMFHLGDINWVSRTAWLGIWVAPECQGKGYGRAILEEGLAYGYAALGLRQVRLEVLSENLPALTLYGSSGFVQEGRLSAAAWVGGEYQDVVIMRHGGGGWST